jgi:hypothetical protein
VCGACGKTTVADPVLGAVRTKRQHLIVAGTVNELCTGQPGAPKVTALADGWLVSGPSGAARLRHTVEELWADVIGCITDASFRGSLRERQLAYENDPGNEGLPARTAAVGSRLAAMAVDRMPAAPGRPA